MRTTRQAATGVLLVAAATLTIGCQDSPTAPDASGTDAAFHFTRGGGSVPAAGCYTGPLGDVTFNGTANQAANLQVLESADGTCSGAPIPDFTLTLVAPQSNLAGAELACRRVGWSGASNLMQAGFTLPANSWACAWETVPDAFVLWREHRWIPKLAEALAPFGFPLTAALTAPLAVGIGDACLGPLPDLTGRIALVARGTCAFQTKSANAEAAGAIAVIIYNNIPTGTLFGGAVYMAGVFNIPAVAVSKETGARLEAAGGASLTLWPRH